MSVDETNIREQAETLLDEQYGIWLLSPEERAELIHNAIQFYQQTIEYNQARKNSLLGRLMSYPLIHLGTSLFYSGPKDETQRQSYNDLIKKSQEAIEAAKIRLQTALTHLPEWQHLSKEEADQKSAEIMHILNNCMRINYNIKKVKGKLKMGTYLEEEPFLKQALNNLQTEKQKYFNAIQKAGNVVSFFIESEPEEKEIEIEINKIKEQADKLMFEKPEVWLLTPEEREALYHKITQWQEDNLAFSEQRKIKINIPLSFFGIKEINVTPIVDFLNTFRNIETADPKLQEQVTSYDKLLEDYQRSIDQAKNNIKKALMDLPQFQTIPEKEANRIVQETIAVLSEWQRIQFNINQIKEKLKAKPSLEEAQLLKTELERLKANQEEQVHKMKQEVNKVIEFLAEDKEFTLERSFIENVLEKSQAVIEQVTQNENVKGALALGSLAFAAGSKTWLGGIFFGLGGAAVGYYFPQVRYVFKPVHYLYQEVRDILTKPGAYLDRAFRGGMTLTATLATVAGITAFAVLVANPFTAVPILSLAASVGLTLLVAAGAAKLSSWISNRVSKKVYGIKNPGRYQLTARAKTLLGKDAPKLRTYFMKEIIAINEELEKIADKASLPAIRLSNQLTALEKVWDKIQAGEDYTSEWTKCARELYRFKKEQYVNALHRKTEKRAKAFPKYLLASDRKNKTFKSANKEGKQVKKNLNETFSFVNKKGGKVEKALKKIDELKEINQHLKKTDKKST